MFDISPDSDIAARVYHLISALLRSSTVTMVEHSKQNLNSASKQDLMQTCSIGKVVAERIIKNGPFSSWRQVSALSFIGPERLANLQAKFKIEASECDKAVNDRECVREIVTELSLTVKEKAKREAVSKVSTTVTETGNVIVNVYVNARA